MQSKYTNNFGIISSGAHFNSLGISPTWRCGFILQSHLTEDKNDVNVTTHALLPTGVCSEGHANVEHWQRKIRVNCTVVVVNGSIDL